MRPTDRIARTINPVQPLESKRILIILPNNAYLLNGRLRCEKGLKQDEDKNMIRNIIMGTSLLFSTSAFALDLQREELLNLYHGVEAGQTNTSQKWVNLSSGIAVYYQGNEQEEIKFAPLPEAETKIGVFTNDSLHKALSENYDYESRSPNQLGQVEDESYGVYIQKSF